MGKVILILIDGCRFDTAAYAAGYLENLVEAKRAAKYRVRGGLPSVSRPMYESMLTGLPSDTHGILTNTYTRSSNFENVFSIIKNKDLSSAAAAYHWVSELYNRNGPFNSDHDRYQFYSKGLIQNGIFYWEDSYPDSHLIADGEYLRQKFSPDFLFLHSMAVDHAGHSYGGESKEYKNTVCNVMNLLSEKLDTWRLDGFDIVITSDHGMDALGNHSGKSDAHQMVPIYILSSLAEGGDFTDKPISYLNTAPLVCNLLHVPVGDRMLKKLEIKLK